MLSIVKLCIITQFILGNFTGLSLWNKCLSPLPGALGEDCLDLIEGLEGKDGGIKRCEISLMTGMNLLQPTPYDPLALDPYLPSCVSLGEELRLVGAPKGLESQEVKVRDDADYLSTKINRWGSDN